MTGYCRLVLGLVGLVLAVTWSAEGKADFRREKRDGHSAKETVEMDTLFGKVKGYIDTSDDGVRIRTFLGIPYTEQPVPRFGLATLRKYSFETLDATELKPRCPHRPIPGDPELDHAGVSEDCLYINIYSPEVAPGEKVPIMFFLHGGGYYGGSGSLYNFKNVAARGVIVVTVNFRLDVFGFLSTQDSAIPGNFGLFDASLAMDWVMVNADSIGGDKDRITAFGGSSGAAMVSIMKMSPVLNGRFHSAILQSGSALAPWAVHQDPTYPNRPYDIAMDFGKRLGCNFEWEMSTRYDLFNCLSEKPWDMLLNVSIEMQTGIYANYFGGMIWAPVIRDTFGALPGAPKDIIWQFRDSLKNIPTIYGYNTQDGSWLIPDWTLTGMDKTQYMDFIEMALRVFPYRESEIGELLKRMEETYMPWPRKDGKQGDYTDQDRIRILVDILTDLTMAVPIMEEARMYQKVMYQEGHSYMYEFNHRPSWWPDWYPWWFGVSHAAEKPFVLGLPNNTEGFHYSQVSESDKKVADHVVTMWTNMAKYWNPTADKVDDVMWPGLFQDNPEMGHVYDDSRREMVHKVLYIQEDLMVKEYARMDKIAAWTMDDDVIESGAALTTPLTPLMTLIVGVACLFLLRF